MKRTIENLTFGIFALGLAFLSLVGFLSYRSNSELIRVTSRISHTYEVLEASERVQRMVDASESALRGFLVTRDQRFAKEFAIDQRGLLQAVTNLKQLTADNQYEQQRIAELEVLVSQRLSVLHVPEDSIASGSGVISSREIGEFPRSIDETIRAISQEERRLLAEREDHAQRITLMTRLVILVGTTLALVLVAVASILIRREALARQRARQRVAVQYATTRLLSESSTLQQAAKRLLPELALTLEFDVAELWMMDYEAGALRCSGHWLSPSVPPSYAEHLDNVVVQAGQGTLGRVYSKQEPVWISDIQNSEDYLRKEQSEAAHLKSAVAVPVLIWPDVAGVLLLLSQRKLDLDREQFQALAAIGAQLGQFITRRRAIERLQETTELQRAILHSANFSIIATDAQGVVKSMNATSEQWLGYTSDDLVGSQTPIVLHEWSEIVNRTEDLSEELGFNVRPGFETLVVKARSGAIDEAEWIYVRRDGSKFPVHVSTTALRSISGEVTGFLFIAQDITERREIDQMKNEFISVVSHELRTPLTSIRGSLGLLASGMLGNISEKAQRMLQIGISNTDRLVRLINDILDIERLESGKIALNRQPLSSEHLVVQATDAMRGMAEKSGVRLEIRAADATIAADSDRIVQTLTNLISNAIKYSNRGATVSVGTILDSGYSHFFVRDTGRGIPNEKKEAIFERFQQVDASDSREKGGTGLGLAISRTIVQQHGGRIWVESSVGEGSTFHFTIPLAEPEARVAVDTPGLGPRVLVCDDDPWLLSVVGNLLTANGFSPIIAVSADEMLQRARAERPDVILLDLVMPGMNGWEALRHLRSDEHLRDVPVIILSGLSERELAGEASGEVSGWVQKPFDARQLCQAVAQIAHRERPLVLLVEDDADLARVVRSTLERDGVEFVVADGASQAQTLVRDRNPDLLILDLVLADGDGYDVVKMLRQHDVLRNIPVVVYSAQEVSVNDRERLRLGETEFLTKTRVSPEELERLVLQLLRREAGKEGNDAKARAAHR